MAPSQRPSEDWHPAYFTVGDQAFPGTFRRFVSSTNEYLVLICREGGICVAGDPENAEESLWINAYAMPTKEERQRVAYLQLS